MGGLTSQRASHPASPASRSLEIFREGGRGSTAGRGDTGPGKLRLRHSILRALSLAALTCGRIQDIHSSFSGQRPRRQVGRLNMRRLSEERREIGWKDSLL